MLLPLALANGCETALKRMFEGSVHANKSDAMQWCIAHGAPVDSALEYAAINGSIELAEVSNSPFLVFYWCYDIFGSFVLIIFILLFLLSPDYLFFSAHGHVPAVCVLVMVDTA